MCPDGRAEPRPRADSTVRQRTLLVAALPIQGRSRHRRVVESVARPSGPGAAIRKCDEVRRKIRRSGGDGRIETAWRIHAAHIAWIESADSKAGLAFALQSATITVTLFLTSNGPAAVAREVDRMVIAAGVAAIMAGAVFSGMVITPHLRTGRLRRESRTDHIYFGHTRLWVPEDLERSIRQKDPVPQISRQIIALAKIAWVKHRRVQASIGLTMAGGAWLTVYAMYVVLR
jgi:Family of unknown function (DUF5706)